MKIVIATNAFKGSINSIDASNIIKEAWLNVRPNDTVINLPLADGGDDFDHVVGLRKNGKWIEVSTKNALNHSHTYGYYKVNTATAVIGLAGNCGLSTLNDNEYDALRSTTNGLGITIKKAIDDGCTEIIIGLGGSASTDFGLGALYELGLKCLDHNNESILPNGSNLSEIVQFELSDLIESTKNIDFYIANDVNNKLYGPQGAAYIFSPQKGASKKEVEILDRNLRHIADIAQISTGIEVFDVEGSGAAGGTAAGFMSFLNATQLSGSSFIMDCFDIDEHLLGTDLIITTEGSLDNQSLNGKLPYQIALKGDDLNIPVIALVGNNLLNNSHQHPFSSIININQKLDNDFKKFAEENLSLTTNELAKLICLYK
ncbi:glycerate kinase [Flammeovirga pacifica]|uniref:Glycerate kinase n=1 Tax=Flammeovirga pacifica TaxID=915059 RepID=A0A1S1YX53_FLAPC|nr:glycerate kinase [Flammeovirga pacifica]OHX65601.1 hypothetical protein NH26_04170 [Flammeovirga pacifica]